MTPVPGCEKTSAVRMISDHTYYNLITGQHTVKLRLRRITCAADVMQYASTGFQMPLRSVHGLILAHPGSP
jgi:hypothetical protein